MAFATVAGILPAAAADAALKRLDVWDVPLGAHASALPPGEFMDYSCGTNGGPPSIRLSGWVDFARCPGDAQGLHEVYFRYDDELEYRGRAADIAALIERFGGTRVGIYPAIVSALFDRSGTVQGIRIVTDPRVDVLQRQSAYMMGFYLQARFGRDGWTCVDLPKQEGETPLAGTFHKQRCEKLLEDKRVVVAINLYQKAGQSVVDPHTAAMRQGYFESSARMEMYRR